MRTQCPSPSRTAPSSAPTSCPRNSLPDRGFGRAPLAAPEARAAEAAEAALDRAGLAEPAADPSDPADPETALRAAAAAAQGRSAVVAAMAADRLALVFDRDRSSVLTEIADRHGCAPEDVAVTAIDWYVDALLGDTVA